MHHKPEREAQNMAFTIKPLADRVIVEPMEAEKMKGGIIIPDTAKEKPQQGKVIAVGPGRVADDGSRVAPEVKKGDIVLYGKYSGTEVSVQNGDYLILREGDILAIL
jgi:chaperonin GroES